MKKVLLMTTPRPEQGDSPLHFGCGRPPQGLGYIAAVLEDEGNEVEILDLYTFGSGGIVDDSTTIQHSVEALDIDVDETIKQFEPDYIGMHISTLTHLNAYELSARLAKDYPHITQVCGGPHPTLFPESVPASFAYAVKGAGEFPMRSIVEEWVIEGKTNGNGVLIIDGGCVTQQALNIMPWPDYSKFMSLPYNYSLNEFGIEGDAIILNTSRGCPYSCRFCAGIRVHPKYVSQNAFRVVAQMHKLNRQFGTTNFYFREDNFTADLTRVEAFCETIRNTTGGIPKYKWVCESRAKGLTEPLIAKMAESGCAGLYIGCESGSDRILELMNKKETTEDYKRVFPLLKKYGINTYTTWMYGFPGEEARDMLKTQRLIEKLQPTSADQFLFIGIPRSEMYDLLDEQGFYEYKDKYGFIFPHGYLEKATALYGKNDPKVQYVRKCYGDTS
jgi:radical SAM superfamily enzyme YgiQ (UPF0313 family)